MFILIGLQFSYLPRKHAHAYLSHLYNLQLTDKLLVSFFLHWILSCKWILVNIIYCLCAFSIIYVSFLTGQQGGYCKLLRGCLLPQEILKKKKKAMAQAKFLQTLWTVATLLTQKYALAQHNFISIFSDLLKSLLRKYPFKLGLH